MKNLLIILFVLTIISACEEKPVTIPEFVPVETGKVMLIEELTGVRCPNCPSGAARLESIRELFPENVVLVGIHGIDLAKPLDESKYDFRNPDAAELEVYLKPFLGKPAAYFNRIKNPDLNGDFGNPFQGQWQGIVEKVLEKPQTLNLNISRNYNPATRQLDLEISALPLQDMNGEFKLSIFIIESDIIDAQDDQFEIVEDYVHNHVLRDAITYFSGDAFADSFKKGELKSASYTYTIPDDGSGLWKPEHLDVVAFIANTEGDSEEVLQAAEVGVLE